MQLRFRNDKKIFSYQDNFKITETISSLEILSGKIKNPDYTIAIPTYKRQHTLKETIKSALDQKGNVTYDIIVVDNNPLRDDETELLLKKYDNPRITYYKNTTNMGMVGNWNRLYTLAKGNWVIMLHDDDLLNNNYLITIDSVIKQHKGIQGVCISAIDSKDVSDLKKCDIVPKDIRLEKLRAKDYIFGNKTTIVGLCLNRDNFMQLGGYSSDYYPCLDYHLNIRYAYYFNLFKVKSTHLAFYRLENNLTSHLETWRGILTKDWQLRKELAKEFPFIFRPFIFSISRNNMLGGIEYYKRIFNKPEVNTKDFIKSCGFNVTMTDIIIGKSFNKFNRIMNLLF